MKTLRCTAALLLSLSLAACCCGVTESIPAELVGRWHLGGPVSGVDYLPIAGTRNVTLNLEWTFRENGTFQERHYARDEDRGVVSESAVRAGVFTASGGVLHLLVTSEAAADPLTTPWPVDLEPAALGSPRSLEREYHLVDGKLSLGPDCPPNANCAALLLSRVD